MLTYEDICEIMGTEPSEIIKCDDGVVMSFGKNDLEGRIGGVLMKQFWVDFSASMLIEAESEEQAREKFFDKVPSGLDFVDVNGVERVYTEGGE